MITKRQAAEKKLAQLRAKRVKLDSKVSDIQTQIDLFVQELKSL